MSSDPQARSAPALVGELLTDVTELFRKEIQLFRAELSEKATSAAAAVGMIAASLVVAIVALNVLAAALVVGITNAGIEAGWAALIVGGVLALIAFFLASRGMNNLKASNLAPARTTRAVERDAALVKEKL
jgi:hypothetical protein